MTAIEKIYRDIKMIAGHEEREYVAESEISRSTGYDLNVIRYLCNHETDMERMSLNVGKIVISEKKQMNYRVTIIGAQYCRDKFGFGFGPGEGELNHG